MTGRLVGRVAVITGGASGIGEASVRRFVAEGARVVIADLHDDAGHALAREVGESVRYVRTDVSVEGDVVAAVRSATDTFGRLDIMFNNAGIIGVTGPISTIDAQAYAKTMAVLVDGVVFGMKAAAGVMQAQGDGGVILSTSSVAALSGGLGSHVYSLAKAAIVGLTQSVAAELWPYAIRVNAIAPGKIMTPMTDAIRARMPDAPAPDLSPAFLRADRRAYAADVANAALFLASDEASFITGDVLPVDGGLVRAGGPSPFAIGNYAMPSWFGRSGER